MKLPAPRILPFAIALTVVGIGMRTVDIVSLALSGSGFSTVTPAIAETVPKPPSPADAPSAPPQTLLASAEPQSPATLGMSGNSDIKSETDLLDSLAKKRQDLDARTEELEQREALLKAAEDRINKKVDELGTMRSDLEKLLGEQKNKDDAQLASLVKIYEDMKPKDAAAIFENLELSVLIDVTSRMKESKLAPVLAAMPPDRARILTVKLSEHRRKMDSAVTDAQNALGPDGAPAAGVTPASADAPALAPNPAGK